MRKNFRTVQPIEANYDSFLDILANTVGALIFISIFISIVVVESQTIVRTPLVKDTDKKPFFFEVKEGLVSPVESNLINEQVGKLLDNLPECDKSLPASLLLNCLENRLDRLKNFQPTTKYYVATLTSIESIAWKYERKDNAPSEGIKDLVKANSDFQNKLRELNSSEYYLAFVVREDSFDAFRAARQIAWKNGFDVGWEPMVSKVPIVFTSGGRGRAVGVQ